MITTITAATHYLIPWRCGNTAWISSRFANHVWPTIFKTFMEQTFMMMLMVDSVITLTVTMKQITPMSIRYVIRKCMYVFEAYRKCQDLILFVIF